MQINAQNRNEIQKEQIMVEILFGESSAGSMKAAKCEDEEYKNGQSLWIQGSSDRKSVV